MDLKCAQRLVAVLSAEHARERGVSSQFPCAWRLRGEDVEHILDRALEQLLPFAQPHRAAAAWVLRLEEFKVGVCTAQNCVRVAHELACYRDVQPPAATVGAVRARCALLRLLHVLAAETAVGAHGQVRQVAGLAQVDDVLAGGTEKLRCLAGGQQLLADR